MNSEPVEYTITRAMAELNVLNKHIQRLINETTFISCGTKNNQQKNHPVYQSVAKFQQMRDLKKRFDTIKSAIIMSNANTTLLIGSKEYTVAEAIARKNNISIDKQMLLQMKNQRKLQQEMVDSQNQQASARLQRLLEQNFGKDNTKTDPTTLKQTEDAFWVNNRWTLIDPLNLTSQIERLEEEIDEFEKNVDFALSESNSINKIRIM